MICLFVVSFLLANVCSASSVASANVSSFRNVTVYSNVTAFPYVHMTMIEQVGATSRIVAAWQTSVIGEGHLDQRIMFAVSDDTGATWSSPREIVSGGGVPVWGPALFYHSQQQRLYLYFSKGVPQNVRTGDSTRHFPGGDIYVTYSDDNGTTWNAANERLLLPFVSQTRGNISKMTANRPVFLTNDGLQWALPFWQEAHTTEDTGPQCAGVLVTRDGGATYVPFGELGKGVNDSWFIENSLVPLGPLPYENAFGTNGSLALLQVFRTELGAVYESVSTDGGQTWGPLVRTTIPNPDSKIYIAARNGTGAGGREILFSGNTDAKSRGLLTVLGSTSASPDVAAQLQTNSSALVAVDALQFANFLTVENNTDYAWDYPTLLPIATPSSERRWAVSFSALSHTAVVITFFNLTAQATNDEKPAENAPGAIAITFGIIGVVIAALLFIVVGGIIRDRRNRSFADDVTAPDEKSTLV